MVSHPSDQSNMNDAGDGFDSDDQPMVGQSTSPYTPSPGPVVKRIAAHSTPQSSSAPASFASRRSQMHNNPLLELQAVEDNDGESHLSDNSDDDRDSASDLSNVTQGVTPSPRAYIVYHCCNRFISRWRKGFVHGQLGKPIRRHGF